MNKSLLLRALKAIALASGRAQRTNDNESVTAQPKDTTDTGRDA